MNVFTRGKNCPQATKILWGKGGGGGKLSTRRRRVKGCVSSRERRIEFGEEKHCWVTRKTLLVYEKGGWGGKRRPSEGDERRGGRGPIGRNLHGPTSPYPQKQERKPSPGGVNFALSLEQKQRGKKTQEEKRGRGRELKH